MKLESAGKSMGHGAAMKRVRLQEMVGELRTEMVRCTETNERAVKKIVALETELTRQQDIVRELERMNLVLEKTRIANGNTLFTLTHRTFWERVKDVFGG